MKANVLLIVPEATSYETMPAEQQAVLESIQCEWPPTLIPNTQAVDGRRIAHVLANCSLDQTRSLIAHYQLPWTVIAFQSGVTDPDTGAPLAELPLDPALILPYLPPIPTAWDEDGHVTATRPVTAEDLRSGAVGLHRYAGLAPWVLAAETTP